jgi:cation diffusion facilitator CzcD-associated flavoprotein CzcO
MTDDF